MRGIDQRRVRHAAPDPLAHTAFGQTPASPYCALRPDYFALAAGPYCTLHPDYFTFASFFALGQCEEQPRDLAAIAWWLDAKKTRAAQRDQRPLLDADLSTPSNLETAAHNFIAHYTNSLPTAVAYQHEVGILISYCISNGITDLNRLGAEDILRLHALARFDYRPASQKHFAQILHRFLSRHAPHAAAALSAARYLRSGTAQKIQVQSHCYRERKSDSKIVQRLRRAVVRDLLFHLEGAFHDAQALHDLALLWVMHTTNLTLADLAGVARSHEVMQAFPRKILNGWITRRADHCWEINSGGRHYRLVGRTAGALTRWWQYHGHQQDRLFFAIDKQDVRRLGVPVWDRLAALLNCRAIAPDAVRLPPLFFPS